MDPEKDSNTKSFKRKPKSKAFEQDKKAVSTSGSKSQDALEQNKDVVNHGNKAKNTKKNGKEKSRGKKYGKISVEKSKKDNKSSKALSALFVFEDISNNKEASSLIHDLIKCFTCNSALPQTELNTLHATLYDRIIFVFLYVLNCFIEKIFRKLQDSDYIQELSQKNRVSKKDAGCQTNITGDIISCNISKKIPNDGDDFEKSLLN